MRVTQNFMKFFHPLKNTHWFNIGKECFHTISVIKLSNDVKKCTNPSTPRRWKDYQKQPHLRLFVLRLKKFFTNGRHTTLIQNHALWLGLFVFLITFVNHFHPIFLIKKVPKLNLKLKIYVPSQTHKVNFLFLSRSVVKNVKITKQNERLDSPQFTERILRDLMYSEKAHDYTHTHMFRCPQSSIIGNGLKKGCLKENIWKMANFNIFVLQSKSLLRLFSVFFETWIYE